MMLCAMPISSSWRSSWKNFPHLLTLKWPVLNQRKNRAKPLLVLCPLTPKTMTSCRCWLKSSSTTSNLWAEVTSELKIRSSTGKVCCNYFGYILILLALDILDIWHFHFTCQVRICVLWSPRGLCVPITLSASTLWALTAVSASLATMMWAPGWNRQWFNLSAMVRHAHVISTWRDWLLQ